MLYFEVVSIHGKKENQTVKISELGDKKGFDFSQICNDSINHTQKTNDSDQSFNILNNNRESSIKVLIRLYYLEK